MLNVTDVRAVAGDAAFLIDDGETAILCDTGFAFTGERVAENVRGLLGDRPLDFIFLTHSHYDHAAGTPYIKRLYPNAAVVASAYAAHIFTKPTARALMRELDAKAARASGVDAYEDLIDCLCVDRTVGDGDEIQAGEHAFRVLSLPGHTKCSVGYFCAAEGLLLSCETLGVYNGVGDVIPSYLVGYQMTMDAIERVRALSPRAMLLPHYGRIEGDAVSFYLARAKERAEDVAQTVCAMLRSGESEQMIRAWFEETFYHGEIKENYPVSAMRLNTGIMIDLLRRELCENAEQRTDVLKIKQEMQEDAQ